MMVKEEGIRIPLTNFTCADDLYGGVRCRLADRHFCSVTHLWAHFGCWDAYWSEQMRLETARMARAYRDSKGYEPLMSKLWWRDEDVG